MGGTFDPIHYGHLVAAESARFEFQLEKVIFVPAGCPPHKREAQISTPQHRLAMTSLAIASNPYFEISDLEIKRPGPSYTYDTVRELKARLAPVDIFFITGADAVMQILSWYRVRDLLAECCFIAVTRPGYDMRGLKEMLRRPAAWVAERVIPHEVPALAISSSDIRRRVRMGRPIKYLLPESVEDYIRSRGLYK